MSNDLTPMPPREPPLGTIALADRLAAWGFAARGVIVLALVAGGLFGLEKLVLTYPARLGEMIDGLPVDRLVELRAASGELVMIGDSVVQTVATDDRDHRMISQMVADDLDGIAMHRVSAAATGADLHRAWLAYLATLDVPPRAVVVEVNPRAFSPHWERNPPWVFDDQAAMIAHPLFARLASVLEWDWERPTDAEYRSTVVWVNGRSAGTVGSLEVPEAGWQAPDQVARGRYLVRYAADYGASRRIHALRALVDEANRAPFPVVLFITPIDREGAAELLSDDELGAIDQNLALLRSELSRSRWPSVDASTLVHHADFDHPDGDPHEHLKTAGRTVVTEALVRALRTLHVGWQ